MEVVINGINNDGVVPFQTVNEDILYNTCANYHTSSNIDGVFNVYYIPRHYLHIWRTLIQYLVSNGPPVSGVERSIPNSNCTFLR